MQILDVANLKPGISYADPLFHQSGRKLLAAHTKLTPMHIEALLRSGITQVFLAPSATPVLEFASQTLKTVPVASLSVGTTAEADLMTPDGVVIIQQNEQVEEHHLVALKDSNVDFLFARPAADVDSVRTTLDAMARVVIGRLEGTLKRGEYLRAPESREPFRGLLPLGGSTEALNLNAVQLMRRRLTARLQPVLGLLETGKSPGLQGLEDITVDLLDLMKSDPRQFSQLALMTSRRVDYLPDHAVSVAVLSMAIATYMNLSLDMVRQVVLGALLFDVGMLVVPKRIRIGSGTLAESDRVRVHQHPVYSISMMEQIPGLTPIPRLMGYQHHERLTGHGYPCGTVGQQISDFARIVAAADVFAAATNPRTYKSAKLPYNAMEELVVMAHKGLLDPRIIKALLAAIGLFPVGSYVVLSNQDTAQVVGANPARIDRPLVRVLESGEPTGPLVDLSNAQYAHIKVIKAVPTPTLVEQKQEA